MGKNRQAPTSKYKPVYGYGWNGPTEIKEKYIVDNTICMHLDECGV